MEKHQLSELQTKALTLLSERDKAMDLFVVHVATDVVPSSKTRIFQFFAASKAAPNAPRHVIVLDEKGNHVDLAGLRKRENVNLLGGRDVRVDRAGLRKLGSAEAMVTISPAENDLTLSPGESHGPEVITVQVPKTTPSQKVDIYFLADTTGSMGAVLDEVKASLGAILSELDGLGLDFAFGAGNYKDFPTVGDPAFQHQLSPSANVVAVQAAIDDWTASGGIDLPEGQLFALDQIAEDRDGTIGWRFNSKRIIVWLGDAPGHETICRAISGLDHDITTGSVIGKLAAASITVIAISTTTGTGLDTDPTAGANDYVGACGAAQGFPGQATLITGSTGGTHLTDIEPTAIVNVIISALTDAALTINRVELDSSGVASDFITAITPGSGYGPLSGTEDHQLRFEVTFRGEKPCSDDGPQVFEGFIVVKVDGNVVGGQKHIKITVPQCVHYVEVEGAPSAAVARRVIGRNGANEINVFVRGTNDQLLRWFNNGDPEVAANWGWEDWGRPGGPGGTRVSDSPFGIASFQESVNQVNDFIHAFVKGHDGHLYEIFWDGAQRSNWIDRNQPYWQSALVTSPTVVPFRRTFYEEGGFLSEGTYWYDSVDQLAAFVWGSDEQLYHHHQVWHPHGRPPSGANVGGIPGAAHRPFYFIYAYFVGNDNHLYASHSTDLTATSWNWVDLGQPTPNVGAGWFRRPGVVPFFFDGFTRLYTFVTGTDGHLWVHVWRGREPRHQNPDVGFWADQGTPGPGVTISSAASVVTCPHNGNAQIYAFVRGSNNNLYVQFWDAANGTWVWRNLGQPSGATVRSDPSAVVCEHAGADPLYVFVRGNDDYLHMCHLDSGATTPAWVPLNV